MTSQLQELQNKLTSLVYQNISAPNSVIATGGITNEIAATNRINQLSGVAITGGTITNATINGISGLTAADIPALAYLSTSGGSLSGALGIGTSMFVSKQYGSVTIISPLAIVVAFLFSALVGLFFGMWPARRAASMDPIVALRYE